ncbi:alkyl hydroperoxide reductase subunit F [Arcanobacterium wilhelmae]|uniref:Alkyl hydroperoxide reductase subunit F n=1 Tax=Arcanobacterium wilhelmae TaxID=1803177 RepID=A0ABT9NB74_9ACTO|nr:alkyl hydroperoxide reductase subunit F [Arcanobacterium wilhelmae]MDP9800974.1 alkyl hydroperoxide reductase subunit F [Arcanobacterium wilhelmae]WFN90334.1 alkyl hydroperoxide reductase subunit F [Arcanobacterium wilhelmae]
MAKKLLDENLSASLAPLMPRITEKVELVASLDERPASADLELLLQDIAALSSNVEYVRDDSANERKPGFTIRRVGTDIAVSFAGIPMGHEFSSLVLALLQVGGNPIKEEPELIDAVAALEGDFEFVTYMSLTCQNCPTVVQALNTMSVINPRIRHTAVEGSLFQDEVNAKNILSVPTIYLNGEEFGQGRTTIEEFVARLDAGAADRAASKMNAAEPYDALVVGQGPAGAAAAIYFARKGLRTAITGERFGGQMNDTLAIENFISQTYTEGPKLSAQLEEHVKHYEIDVYPASTATSLTPASAEGELHTVHFGEGALKARTVVVATGARWRLMGVPGEEEYRNKGVTFCPHCDGPLFKGKKVAVIGGGNSGIEAAIDVAVHASHVTVLEFADKCRADDVLMDSLAALPNADVITNAATTAVLGDGSQVTGLAYTDRASGEEKQLELSGIFVQIGLLPNTEWLGDAVELNAKHEIATDGKGATNVPGIYAAGDCSDTAFKQIVIASGSGATAALSAWDRLIRL